jgi:hypothetical protein
MLGSYGPGMARTRIPPFRTRTFLVERYRSGLDEASARAAVTRLERAAEAMTAEGNPVVHVGSVLMPVDEVVFTLIDAIDEDAARQVHERADLSLDRIADAIQICVRRP